MTNATKTLAIIFAGTLALALATSWSWSTTSSAAFQKDLLAVDTSAVQAIRIEHSDRPTVRLERSGGSWSVAPADTSVTYPASAQSVDQLLGTLPTLQVSAVATRQPDKHPRYGVDSTGTFVTMLGADNDQLGQLLVGRTQIQRSQSGGQRRTPMRRQRRGTPITYVRPPDRPDVYSVEQSLRSLANRSVEDWRDKQIWALDRSQIQRVDFRYPADSSFTARRVSSGDTATTSNAWVSAGDTLSRSEVSSMLRLASSPEADGFVEDTSPKDLGDAPYEIRLHLSGRRSGTRRSLQLRPNLSGKHYIATATGYPYVVQLRADSWDQSVLQGRSAYLKNK